MGVDLATYRARIGSFFSRKNVSCNDEKRMTTSTKERLRVKLVSKALSTTNLNTKISSFSHLDRIEFDTLLGKSSQGQRQTVHVCPHNAERFALALVMAMTLSCMSIIQRLLLLSGDVETNPGPLGQHTEDSTFIFKNIINAIKAIVEWKTLGTQLDISAAKIKEISVNNQNQVAECKHDLVQFWLESDTSCSWKKLVEALSNCDHSVLAKKIEKTYCPRHEGIDLDDSEQKNTESDHEQGITEQQRKEHEGSGATYQKIAGNTKSALGFNTVQNNCGCGECDFKSLISNGCRTPRKKPFIHLDTLSLNPTEEVILLSQLQKAADSIFDQLDKVAETFCSWMKDNVSIGEYKEILLTINGITSATKNVYMLQDREKEIMAATDHMTCFKIVKDYYSWFNCSILEKIINKAKRMIKNTNDSPEFFSNLQSYMEKLHSYCERNIYECPDPADMSPPNCTAFLVLKVTKALSIVDMIISAEQIAMFTTELMERFETQDCVLKLHTVGEGCVEVVYSIPLCIYNELFPLNEDHCTCISLLGVMELITKDYHYKKDSNGSLSQMLASENGHEENVLSAGALQNRILPPGSLQLQDKKTGIWIPQTLSGTPVQWLLHKACIDADLIQVKDLVENHGHDPQLKDENGDTALNVAALSGQLEILKYFIENRNCSAGCLGRDDRTLLHNACQENGNITVVKYLIEKHNCQPSLKDKQEDTPLNIAALSGHLDIVTYLIEEKHCAPDCPGRSPLHKACQNSATINIVKYLVENHKCDPRKKDDKGNTSLNVAALSGCLDTLQYFIDSRKCSARCPGHLGRLLLHNACEENGNLAVVKYLVEKHNCDPSEKDEEGNTPLHIAAFSGHLDILIYFIEEKKCNPEFQGKLARTPVFYACRKSIDMVKYLVEKHGCDPTHKDTDGNFPLFAAVHFDNFDVIKYLLEERKCDPKSRGVWKRSLLHIACIVGNLNVVKYLVEEQGCGCDFHYKDIDGFIPLDGAICSNNASVITYLKERMGITLPPCQPILPPGAVQVQDEKTRIWKAQYISGTPVPWVHPSLSNDLGPMVPAWCPIQLWDGTITFANSETKKRVAEDPRNAVIRYKQALKDGSVSVYLIKVLIIGTAGVGKTHLLHLLFNEDPPDTRESTPLMERPVQAIQSVLKDSTSFEKVTDGQLNELLGHSVNDNVKSKIDGEKSSFPQQSCEKITFTTAKALQPITVQSTMQDNTVSKVEENLVPSIIDSKDASPLKDIDWVYFIDSGGQPQFHQLLPAFMQHKDCNKQKSIDYNSLTVFVFRLCDKLSDQATIEFYEEGKCIYSKQSLHTNMEILRYCAQPIQAARHDGNSRLIIVGTHRDLEHQEETVQKKNETLSQLLNSSESEYVMLNNHQVIFPLNTKEPDESDKVILNELRTSIISMKKRMKAQEIPLKWLVFHQELQALSKEESKDIFTLQQCTKVAARLQMDNDDTIAALIFFSNLNVILYYPEVLPNVVFINSQSLLNIVTSLIKYIVVYGTNCSHSSDPELIKAREKGIISVTILHWMELEDLPQLYKSTMVEAKDLIKLFLHLQILCEVKGGYFMPSLLKGLEDKGLEEELSKHPDSVAPCAICYEDNRWMECGAFAFLITSLLSSEEWKLVVDKSYSPLCVYSNIIKMTYDDLGIVTLVDHLSHLQIHIHGVDQAYLIDICPKIVNSIMNSLQGKPILTCVCPCQQSERHVVTPNIRALKRKQVICSKDSRKRFKLDELSVQPLIWTWDSVAVLESNYEQLVNDIQTADALANSLYSKKIIAENIRDMVHNATHMTNKNKILLDAIHAAVSISPDYYEVFTNDVITKQPLLEKLLPSPVASYMHDH